MKIRSAIFAAMYLGSLTVSGMALAKDAKKAEVKAHCEKGAKTTKDKDQAACEKSGGKWIDPAAATAAPATAPAPAPEQKK